MFTVQFDINNKIYLRNPQSSSLGNQIFKESILLIDEIGFESFTFKKLASRIGSTEASIYRYFENKHHLLVYHINWYWEWVRYQIIINIRNIDDPLKKLHIIIDTLVDSSEDELDDDYLNLPALHRVIISESSKAYHTKYIDQENKDNFFRSYKELVADVAEVITSVNKNFKYPRTLASNLFEMSNNQIYFAEHLPKLTDIRLQKDRSGKGLKQMLKYFVKNLLATK